MSYSRNNRNKAKKAAQSTEEKRIRRLIKQGTLPKYSLVKFVDDKGKEHPEKVPHKKHHNTPRNGKRRRETKMTLRQQSTLAILLKTS